MFHEFSTCRARPSAPFVPAIRLLGVLAALLPALLLAGCGGDDDETPDASIPTRLVASDSNGVLYDVHPVTGETTELVTTGLGPIVAMAFDPLSATLFGATDNTDGGDPGTCPTYSCLYRVDRESGAPTLLHGNYDVALSGWGDNSARISALARNPSDGTLYAIWFTECPIFFSIDKTDGAPTPLNTGLSGCGGDAMAMDGAGVLYNTSGSQAYTLDSDGAQSPLGTLVFSGFEVPPTALDAMTAHPTSGNLIALANNGDLVDVDLCALTVTYVATPSVVLDGLALIHGGALPAPPTCD